MRRQRDKNGKKVPLKTELMTHLDTMVVPVMSLEHSVDKFSNNPELEDQHRKSDFYKKVRDSIAEQGLQNPIIVRTKKTKEGKWKIAIGNNRYLACKELGITDVPVHIGDYNRAELLDIKRFFKPTTVDQK